MSDFIPACKTSDIPPDGKLSLEVDDRFVVIACIDGEYFCIDDVCTHDGGPLADGELHGFRIACPRHGAKFDIRTGAALTMPAIRPTRSHEVKVEDGGIWVKLRDVATADGPSAHAVGMPQPSASPSPALASAGSTAGESASEAAASPAPAGLLCEDTVRETLKGVIDPELFVNIVDLGLIYGVTLTRSATDAVKHAISVDMTMTSPACPAGPQLIADTKRVLTQRPDVESVEVRIVMDPPWTPDRMTEAARDQLGIF